MESVEVRAPPSTPPETLYPGTPVHPRSAKRVRLSLAVPCQACGSLNYFHHGGGKNGTPEGRGYLCDNIKVDGYLEITTPSAGCTLVTGLREGAGADNPATWDDVVVDAPSESLVERSYGHS